jgi:hypothetical protein
MRLSRRDREALLVAGDGRPIYRFSDGPRVLRPDGSWLEVAPATIERLEKAGLLAWSETFWLVTEEGRARALLLARGDG